MGDYVLVPRVATAEMHRASVEDVPVYPAMGERWKAMLAARPPVEWTDLMAMATVAVDKSAAPHILADADMRRTIICCTAQALREVMK